MWIGEIAAGGCHHLGHKFIQGPTFLHLFFDPLLKHISRLHQGARRCIAATDDPQVLAPDCCPDIGKGLVCQQGVNFPIPFVGCGVSHEGLVLSRCWRTGNQVKRDPPQKGLVVTEP